MLNRLFSGPAERRSVYVDSTGRVSRTAVDTWAGVPVDTESALSVPAIWRAVTMISDTVGALSIHAYRNDQILEPTPRILERPYALETRVETFSAMAAALIIHGNYIAILGEPGPSGYPESFYPVAPDRVTVFREKGERFYRVDNEPIPYTSSQILHIKGFSLPGDLVGLGILAAQRQGIAAAVAVLEYAARYFDGGAMPSYVLKSENDDLTEIEAQALKSKWIEVYGGRNREPVVLNSSTSALPLNANANDAQLIETRLQSTSDAANIVGIPGTMVGAPNSSRTYSNVEAQSLEYLRTSIMPITSRIESALSDYLPRGQRARFSYDSLLRADTLTRYQAHEIALRAGFLTVDEIRELEDRPPAGVPIETGTEDSPV